MTMMATINLIVHIAAINIIDIVLTCCGDSLRFMIYQPFCIGQVLLMLESYPKAPCSSIWCICIYRYIDPEIMIR